MDDSTQDQLRPLKALDYAPPPARKSVLNLWLLLSTGLAVGLGVGLVLFGLLSAARMRDDEAGPISIGAGLIIFGATLGLAFWLRRHQSID